MNSAVYTGKRGPIRSTPLLSNLQERREERRKNRVKRGKALDEGLRKLKKYISEVKKTTQFFSKLPVEDIFEELEEYFWQADYQVEIDHKRYKMTVLLSSEAVEDEQQAIDHIKIEVQLLECLEERSTCIEFKRVNGDPFEYFDKYEEIQKDLLYLTVLPEGQIE